MIWYLILALIIAGPFIIYFVVKALQSSFNRSKNHYIEAQLVRKTINNKEEIEKDIIFDEVISEKKDTSFTLEFMTSESKILKFNVSEEDFNSVQKDMKGILCYKVYLGIPTYISFMSK